MLVLKKTKKTMRGAALGIVLVASIVVLSICASLLFYLDASILQASAQERNLKALYAAESGINVGVAALLTPVRVDPSDPTSDQTLYSGYQNGYNKVLTETYDINPTNPGETIVILEISLYIDPAAPTAPAKWVQVKATGQTQYRSKTYEKTSVLLVSLDDPAVTKRQ